VARFVAKNSPSFSILVSGLCMLYRSFYCTFFLLSPIDKAWSQVLRDLTEYVSPPPPSHEDGNRSSFQNVVFSRTVVFNLGYAKTSLGVRKIKEIYILFHDKHIN
jgi:hypothetical protein